MRLNTLSRSITEQLLAAQSGQQRAAALIACRMAIDNTSLKHVLVDEVLDVLQAEGKITDHVKAALSKLADELDNGYFDLANKTNSDSATEMAARQMFCQARAVTALRFACDDDIHISAAEAVYEAAMSTDDPSQVLDAVERFNMA